MQLVELELVAVLAAVVLERPAAVLVALGSARILEHPVDRDELRHHQLAHRLLLSSGVQLRRERGSDLIGLCFTVVSNTLTELLWANTTVLSGDVAAVVGELKAKPGGELQVHGSGTLIRWLLDSDLVDEITLLIVPVVVGQGMRLFPDAGPDIALELVDSRADSKGVTIQVYRPTGRPHYATAAAARA